MPSQLDDWKRTPGHCPSQWLVQFHAQAGFGSRTEASSVQNSVLRKQLLMSLDLEAWVVQEVEFTRVRGPSPKYTHVAAFMEF